MLGAMLLGGALFGGGALAYRAFSRSGGGSSRDYRGRGSSVYITEVSEPTYAPLRKEIEDAARSIEILADIVPDMLAAVVSEDKGAAQAALLKGAGLVPIKPLLFHTEGQTVMGWQEGEASNFGLIEIKNPTGSTVFAVAVDFRYNGVFHVPADSEAESRIYVIEEKRRLPILIFNEPGMIIPSVRPTVPLLPRPSVSTEPVIDITVEIKIGDLKRMRPREISSANISLFPEGEITAAIERIRARAYEIARARMRDFEDYVRYPARYPKDQKPVTMLLEEAVNREFKFIPFSELKAKVVGNDTINYLKERFRDRIRKRKDEKDRRGPAPMKLLKIG